MSKELANYIKSLSEEYINLTLDYNIFERFIQDLTKIIKSKKDNDEKINKIKELLEVLNEKTR